MMLVKKIMVLGATGNFGAKIVMKLAKENISLIISGRNQEALSILKDNTHKINSNIIIEIATFDIHHEIKQKLTQLKPFIVINTCGPFELNDYFVAICCVDLGIHYLDLADGRGFVNDIHYHLNDRAILNNCVVISGASTVPTLSSAVIEDYKPQFAAIQSLNYGITIGQKIQRGLATTKSILNYVGKELKPIKGATSKVYGWGNLSRQKYPVIGSRWMATCDIPDFDIFPEHYKIEHIKFSAGLENGFLHFGLCLASWVVRLGIPFNLPKYANGFLKVSNWFNSFGTNNSGMHMILSGLDNNGNKKIIKWYLIAQNGDGPSIPITPVIILSKKLLSGEITISGAFPCIGLITIDEYLNELKGLNIRVYSEHL